MLCYAMLYYLIIFIYQPSSSCHTTSTGLLDPLRPPVSVVYRSRKVFKPTSCIGIELLYIGFSWSSCVGVHRSMSLMSSSPHLQQYPTCLVRLAWILFVMGGRWAYSCRFYCIFLISYLELSLFFFIFYVNKVSLKKDFKTQIVFCAFRLL